MAQTRMTQEEYRALTGNKTTERRGGNGPRVARGRKQSEWAERFAVTPARSQAETDALEAQRALFEVHEPVKIAIRLPLSPSVNSYWRTFVVPGSKTATTYVSEEGKAYYAAVKAAWIKHHNGWPPDPVSGPLRLFMLVHYHTAAEIDLDNRVKALQDALASAGAYLNDKQIKHLGVREGPIVKPYGAIDVWLESYTK